MEEIWVMVVEIRVVVIKEEEEEDYNKSKIPQNMEHVWMSLVEFLLE